MNRRAFLRGSTALGLAALVPGRGLPAEIAAPAPKAGMAILMENADSVYQALLADITRMALRYADQALRSFAESWERDLTLIGTPPVGTMIRFRRPVEFHLVEPYEITPKQLALMELERNMRELGP